MPQTAQLTTPQRASAYDNDNSPEIGATIEDVVRDRDEFAGMMLPHGPDASTTSVRDPQADATPSRLFTGSDQNETRPTRVVNLPGPRATPKLTPSLHALQEWEGYVTEINDSEFVANLLDVTAGDTFAGEEVVIPLEEISEADVARMHAGSIFRWVIGYERAPSGSKRRVSQIVFRNLPAFTKKDLQEAEEWAEKMMSVFEK